MAYSIMDYGFCVKCGDDDNIYYCKEHEAFLCFKCDSELHRKMMQQKKTLQE